MKPERSQQLRYRITQEAARLMYEEGVGEYFTAKRIAVKRVLGSGSAKKVRYRPQDLPSNGEICEALRALASLVEGPGRQRRLFVMRVLALEVMHELQPFDPCLIGSVSTGHVRKGSDIDLHVFVDDLEQLEVHLESLDWQYELSEVSIRRGNEFREYTHIHLHNVFSIELSLYESAEKRIQQRSSTDGKPIVRMRPRQLEALLLEEHFEDFIDYQRSGYLEGLEQFEDEAPFLSMAEQQDRLSD